MNSLEKKKPFFLVATWFIVGLIYFPIFFIAWVLHVIARLLLSISYLGMLNGRIAKDIFKSIFKFNPFL